MVGSRLRVPSQGALAVRSLDVGEGRRELFFPEAFPGQARGGVTQPHPQLELRELELAATGEAHEEARALLVVSKGVDPGQRS